MGILSGIGHFLFGGGTNKTTSDTTTNAASSGQTTANSTNNTSNTGYQAANTDQMGYSAQNPYAPVAPSILDYINKVGSTYANTPQIGTQEQAGYDALTGLNGQSGSLDAALSENQKTASGAYLTPDTNPYLADIAKRVGSGALQTINTTFANNGRNGGGLHAQLAGQGVADSLTNLYGSEYDKERALQQGAVGQAAGLEQARYINPDALITAGQAQSARPYDTLAQQGGILASIAGLGSSGVTGNTGQVEGINNSTGTTDSTATGTTNTTSNGTTNQVGTSPKGGNGLVGDVITGLTNKFFGLGGKSGGGASSGISASDLASLLG